MSNEIIQVFVSELSTYINVDSVLRAPTAAAK